MKSRLTRPGNHVLLLLITFSLGALALPAPRVHAQANDGTTVEVYLWPDETEVQEGERLHVTLQVRNEGDEPVRDVEVRMPRDDYQYVYIDTSFTTMSDSEVMFTFDAIAGHGGEVLKDVWLRVQNDPPFETFSLYADYAWTNAAGNRIEWQSQRTRIAILDLLELDGDEPVNSPDKSDPLILDVTIEPHGIDGYRLSWEASDISRIAHYDVDYRILPDGGWTAWRRKWEKSYALLAPTEGNEFAFRLRATDRAGNQSAWYEVPFTTLIFE